MGACLECVLRAVKGGVPQSINPRIVFNIMGGHIIVIDLEREIHEMKGETRSKNKSRTPANWCPPLPFFFLCPFLHAYLKKANKQSRRSVLFVRQESVITIHAP